jgi:predicted nuclease with TOPRIM domain
VRTGEQSEKYAEECSALEEELEKLLTRAEENKRKAQQVAAEIQRLEDELAQLGEAQEEASQQTAQMNERFRQLTDDITSAQSVEVERKGDRARYSKAPPAHVLRISLTTWCTM